MPRKQMNKSNIVLWKVNHQLSSTMIDPENIEPIILFIGERNAAMGFKNINMKKRGKGKKETCFIIGIGCEPKLRWSGGLPHRVG